MREINDNREVTLNDLYESGLYDNDLLQDLQMGDFRRLANLPIEKKTDKKYMEPLLYAVRNKLDTFMVYKYYGKNLQDDVKLASEIIVAEPDLIEGTPISKDRNFIIQNIETNPQIIRYMSPSLKTDVNMIKELTDIENQAVRHEIAENCDIKLAIQCNPKLKNDKDFMVEAIKKDVSILSVCSNEIKSDYNSMLEICKENNEAISYVASNADEFGKEGLQATKDVLIDKSSNKAIDGFKEELGVVDSQIEQAKKEGKSEEDLKNLSLRSKQLERHAKFFEKIRSGEIDPVRAAKLINKICQGIEPEYRKQIEQLLTLDNVIIERDKEVEKKKEPSFRESLSLGNFKSENEGQPGDVSIEESLRKNAQQLYEKTGEVPNRYTLGEDGQVHKDKNEDEQDKEGKKDLEFDGRE